MKRTSASLTTRWSSAITASSHSLGRLVCQQLILSTAMVRFVTRSPAPAIEPDGRLQLDRCWTKLRPRPKRASDCISIHGVPAMKKSILVLSVIIIFSATSRAQDGHEYAPIQEKTVNYKSWTLND